MKIIYFDIDCLRPDHLGCYGYNRPTSPNIDAIAKDGIRFNHYYCASSPCLPSRTGLMSGRFGIRNGVCSNHSSGAEFHLPVNHYGGAMEKNEMFPRQLRKHGMDTICISNFADRHAAYYYMCGWSEFFTPNLKIGNETAEEVNEFALKWLDDNRERDNFYLHINYWDTHRVYKMAEEYGEPLKEYPIEQSWPDEDTIKTHNTFSGAFTAQGQFHNNISHVPLMPGAIRNRKDFYQMIHAYDTSIRYVDLYLGQIISKLKEYGMYEDTAIIISSDHGDAFGEHGIYSDHVCADDCIHHIPLIIRWPGAADSNTADDSFMYNTDYAPTICDLLGYAIPEDWDGKSYAGNIKGGIKADRDYLVWDHALYAVARAVRTKTHLMIRTYDNFGYEIKPVELYDMIHDKYQANDISESCPDMVSHCDGLMQHYLHEALSKPPIITDPLIKVLQERRH